MGQERLPVMAIARQSAWGLQESSQTYIKDGYVLVEVGYDEGFWAVFVDGERRVMIPSEGIVHLFQEQHKE